MSRQIITPIGPNGAILDGNIAATIPSLAGAEFGVTDVVIFSHGWWTNAQDSMAGYATFSTGQALAFLEAGHKLDSLEIGVHWPATAGEDANLLEKIAQPFSFFSRSLMANAVGKHGVYALIRLILEERISAGLPMPRFTLVGHSFGCKVVSSALQAIAAEPDLKPVLAGLNVNLVLLQAAFDNDSFEPGQDYCLVLDAFPKLRLLATRSSLDSALCVEYPRAERLSRLFGTVYPAMGAAGPSDATATRLNAAAVEVGLNYVPSAPMPGRAYIADLSTLHAADGYSAGTFSGHHSDIFRTEIYRLISAFVAA